MRLSDAFVFPGATGDRAYRKIFPALQAMIKHDGFDMPVIGIAHAGWNIEQLQARARDSLEYNGFIDEQAFSKLCSLLQYIDGDYNHVCTFARLRKILDGASRPLPYLAIPPTLFATVIRGLSSGVCTEGARTVVEKPFGRDPAPAQELNRNLHSVFDESATATDEVAWRVVDPILNEPVESYEPGTWGPASASAMIPGNEGWHDPKPETNTPC